MAKKNEDAAAKQPSMSDMLKSAAKIDLSIAGKKKTDLAEAMVSALNTDKKDT